LCSDCSPAAGHARLQLQGEDTPEHDAVVVCTGAEAANLLAPLSLRLPMIALRGALASVLRCANKATRPRHAIVDWSEQMTLVRLGQRMRGRGRR
jgi:D-amino-acid dehydrogenase